MRHFSKKITYVAAFIVSLLPGIASAHERWFVQEISAPASRPLLFSTWNPFNAALTILLVFGFVVALILHFVLRPLSWVKRMRHSLFRYRAWVPQLARTFTGILLTIGSFAGFVFAPDLQTFELPAFWGRLLFACQWIIGFCLITGLFLRTASATGVLLYVGLFFLFPFTQVIGYFSFAGIFVYLFIMGDPSLPRIRGEHLMPNFEPIFRLNQAKPFAFSILRIATGLSFIIIAVLYKLYDPSYALELLRTHPLNFMPALGITTFTNEMFVIMAGFIELFVGLLIIMGFLPRLMGVSLLILFTVTLRVFGLQELVGHLALFAVAIGLIIQGGGERWSLEARAKPNASYAKDVV